MVAKGLDELAAVNDERLVKLVEHLDHFTSGGHKRPDHAHLPFGNRANIGFLSDIVIRKLQYLAGGQCGSVRSVPDLPHRGFVFADDDHRFAEVVNESVCVRQVNVAHRFGGLAFQHRVKGTFTDD